MRETGYSCKQCGAPAEVDAAGIRRSCVHNGTVVLALDAELVGLSEAGGDVGRENGFLAFFNQIGVLLMEKMRGLPKS